MRRTIAILFLLATLTFAPFSSAQTASGTPPFGSFGGGPFDVINLGNLNVHFVVPIRHKAERQTPFSYDLSYDNSIWTPVTSGSSKSWQPAVNAGQWGWQGLTPAGVAWTQYYMTYSSGKCGWEGTSTYQEWDYSSFVYHDLTGTSHSFSTSASYIASPGGTSCPPNGPLPPTPMPSSVDGYTLTVSPGPGTVSTTLTDSQGNTINAPASTTPPTGGSYSSFDRNGNQITATYGVWTDTLGTTALSVTGSAPSNTTLSYTAPSGAAAPYTVSYKAYTVATAFSSVCSGITDYNQSNKYLVDKITRPDGTTYQFAYEPTSTGSTSVTARIAQVTLPTGGTVQYTYGPINCIDGSATSLTRTLNPGGTWNYSRTQTGTDSHWQTTITDPTTTQNQTTIDFQRFSSNFYETQGVAYQGSVSANNALSTVITCYNTASPTPASCPTTAITAAITRRTIFTYLPTSAGVQAETDIQYSSGFTGDFPTEVDSYDYGAKGSGAVGALIRKVLTTYSVFNAAVLPTSIKVEDTNNVVKASTTYSYDQTALTATSGTPQHITQPAGLGNLTTLATKVSGSVTLYRRFTYYDTGTMKTSTDSGTTSSGGPNITTYNYNNTGTPSPSCGNSFATSISEPLSLSRSMTWDCNGGVMTSATDENGKTATSFYTGTGADPSFWRPYQAQDQLSNTTTFSYPSATASESSMLFNSNNSVVDQRSRLDDFGRPIVGQTLQAPGGSTYDAIETDYDVAERIAKVTRPYSAATDSLCSGTCPGTSVTYDALGRPSVVTDGGGGTITSTYSYNDTLQVVGPAPTGEHTKQKQLEYNALGWLTSVCEITAVTGSGACGQNSSQTGFLTKYAYDLLGNMTGVTQNTQPGSSGTQTRTYTFDMLGRLTSELNPETGTAAITYIYDSWDASCGTYTSAGDPVEKKDAMGNVACIKYDALHRATDVTYPAGNYASATAPKHYVYDSATVNGTAMNNPKGRLAEAYTGTSGSKTTDLGFSYSARGEVTDVWESTTNSGGYYHVNAAYWANGKLNVLNGGTNPLPGLPAITYGVNGEGRASTVSAATGQNPVTATSYNVAHQVTGLAFGSADSDSYTYDPNTGRMTQYQFSMAASPNTKTDTGALTWNANGTLGQLQITDQINTPNSQTCTFSRDDLVRITSANCGSVWAQTFAFDPFGNLSKTGSAQFLPTYTGATGAGSPTNQYYQISGGGSGTSNYYDANGNLTNDVTHSYTWDTDGRMLSVDSSAVQITYDAFDRMIEQTRGSSRTQIVYSVDGTKLALMHGQTLAQARVPTPSGAKVVYGSSGLAFYRHIDQTGNSRLETTSTRTKYCDVAYAPYGEDYAGSGTSDVSFSGQETDTISGTPCTSSGGWPVNLYDFLFREYRTAHGRGLSPGPSGLAGVHPADPQSWNRYSYLENRVLTDVGVSTGAPSLARTVPQSSNGSFAPPMIVKKRSASFGVDKFSQCPTDPNAPNYRSCWQNWVANGGPQQISSQIRPADPNPAGLTDCNLDGAPGFCNTQALTDAGAATVEQGSPTEGFIFGANGQQPFYYFIAQPNGTGLITSTQFGDNFITFTWLPIPIRVPVQVFGTF